jgi:hypothetical protein
MTLRIRYLTWKIRVLCWVLRKTVWSEDLRLRKPE